MLYYSMQTNITGSRTYRESALFHDIIEKSFVS